METHPRLGDMIEMEFQSDLEGSTEMGNHPRMESTIKMEMSLVQPVLDKAEETEGMGLQVVHAWSSSSLR